MAMRESLKKGKRILTTESELLDYAAGALGRRMRTAVELKRLLRQRVPAGTEGATLIDAVLARLQSLGYLSDARYAQNFTSLRKDNQKLGQRRIAADLLARGVHPDVVQREVGSAFAETDEATQARAFLARKRIAPPTDEKAAARVFRALVRAGFAPGTVMRIIKESRASARGGRSVDFSELPAEPADEPANE